MHIVKNMKFMEEIKLEPRKRITVTLEESTYIKIQNIAKQNDDSITVVVRHLLERGLAKEFNDESADLIAHIVRQQMDAVIKPHIERLASISSKAGHMSATSTFLNAQALTDLVPNERRRDIRTMYENARKQAVEFMRRKTTEYERDF